MNNITYGKCSQCGDTLTAAHVCPGGMLESRKDSPEQGRKPDPEITPSPIMKFFEYKHLPIDLQVVSARLCDLAFYLDQSLPMGPEKSAGLRKLLEAKDCFVRAHLK